MIHLQNNFSINNEKEKWLSKVPDDRKLSKLSIPGTHGSLTLDYFNQGQSRKCHDGSDLQHCLTQDLTLQQQLEAGIRFINLELHNDGTAPEKITCYFGRTNLRIHLREVLDILNAFLSAYSKEMVFLQYNWKGTAINVLNDIFNEYSASPKELIYADAYANDQYATPVLGQVRGKVVLINSDKVPSKGSVAFNQGSSTVIPFQNKPITNANGACEPFHFVSKLKRNIDSAGEVMVADQYYITWATYNVYPCQCRPSFNLALQKSIYASYEAESYLAQVGIVVMDFPEPEYISNIIRFNFQGMSFQN